MWGKFNSKVTTFLSLFKYVFIFILVSSIVYATNKFKDIEVKDIVDSPFMEMEDQSSSPSNAETGKFKLFFLNGELTKRDSAGVETGLILEKDLSNLISPTSINQDLLPDSDLGRSLGSTVIKWNTLNVESISSDVDSMTITAGDIDMTTVAPINWPDGLRMDNTYVDNFWAAANPGFVVDSENADFQASGAAFQLGTTKVLTPGNFSGEMFYFTGENFQGTGGTGSHNMVTGDSNGPDTGGLFMSTGGNTGAAGGDSTGPMFFDTGNANGGVSGNIRFTTGNSTSSDSGGISFQTGTANGGAGDSGDISFTTSTAGLTRGNIIFQEGTQGISGECWVSINTSGAGNWETCPGSGGADTDLGNLVATSINQALLPDATANNRDLGSAGFQWDDLFLDNNITIGTDFLITEGNLVAPSGPTGSGLFDSNDDLVMLTSNRAGAVDSDGIFFETGTVVDGTSGNIQLHTGVESGTGAFGDIVFQDGSEGTSGHCWVSTGTLGEGNWEACSATKVVISNAADQQIESALVSCTSGSTIITQTGTWLSSIGNVASGACAIVIATGIFSTTPHCVVSHRGALAGTGIIVSSVPTSATALSIDCVTDAGVDCSAYSATLNCMGTD